MQVSTHINRGVRQMAVLSVAFFAGAVPAQAATTAQVYGLQHSQPESVALVTDNSTGGTTDTAQVVRLHTRAQSVPLVTDNSGRSAATTASRDYGPLDPIIANAVRESTKLSYGPLDPIIANAVRESSQLDPIMANAVRESKHPTSEPTKLTTSAGSTTGFDWRDTGIGLAAFSALMALGFAGMTAKRRRDAFA